MKYFPRHVLSLVFSLLPIAAISQGQRLSSAVPDSKLLPGAEKSGGGSSNLYSPNLYDGTANIHIPIYHYQVDNADFGVSFNYNTRGVKVDEIASDIGLHFNINSNATINRTVKDLPDEINLLDGDTIMFMWSGQVWNAPHPGVPPAPNDTVSLNKYWCFKGKLATYSESPGSTQDGFIYRDKEADDFTVTLGDGSFTFNLGKDGTVFTNPLKTVTITPMWGDQPLGSIGDMQPIGQGFSMDNLLGFTIRESNGITYFFKRGEYEQKSINDLYGKGWIVTEYSYTTQWVVSKVILPNGAEINYDYDVVSRGPAVLPLYKSYLRMEGRPLSYFEMAISNVTKSAWTMSKLKSISYPNNVTVYFNYDLLSRMDYPYGALKEVRVTTPQTCLSYQMKQSFFYSDAPYYKNYADGLYTNEGVTRDLKGRLRLDSINIVSCDGTSSEPYFSFSYETEPLPARLDYRQDFFGYFNGKQHVPFGSTIEESVPTQLPFHPQFTNAYATYTSSSGGMDRSSDLSKMKAGILKSITNASGGATTFFYGENTGLYNVYTGFPNGDSLYQGQFANDGLRLDSIVEAERINPGNKKVTVFEYADGQRFLPGGYFHFPDLYYGRSISSGIPPYIASINMTGQFVTPHQLINGSNHGYSFVTMKTKTGEGDMLSKKEVTFTNFKDEQGNPRYFVVGGGKDFFIYPYTDKSYIREWEMGLIAEIKEYDQNDKIITHTTNKYRFTIDTTSMIGKVENIKESLVPIDGIIEPGLPNVYANTSFTDSYRPYTGAALLDSVIVKKYISDNNFITTYILNDYDFRNNLSSMTTFGSNGDIIRTDIAYNYGMNAPLGSTLKTMTDSGIEKRIGHEKWLLGSGDRTTDKLLEAEFNTYSYQEGILRPQHIYKTQIGEPINYNTYTGYTGGLFPPAFGLASAAFTGGALTYFKKLSEVTLVDGKANPLETALLAQLQFKAAIWDTLTGRKIAEANTRYNDIAYSGFDASVKGNWEYNMAGAINLTGPIAGRKAFNCSMGAISRDGLTPGKEYIISLWCTTMPSCTIGATPVLFSSKAIKGNWTHYEGRFTVSSGTQILSLSASANQYLDELRLFPVESSMQTWTYDGLFGLVATADPSGRMTYFEYDKFGRQVIIRDQEGFIISKTEFKTAN